ARADEENERERDLRSHNPARGRGVGGSAGGLRLAFFHRGHGVDTSGAERGQDSKEHAAEHGDGDGEGKYAAVHFQVEKDLVLLRGNETDEQRAAPTRKENAKNRAGSGKRDAFREHLTNQASARCAQRQPYRNFLLTSRRARQQ